MMLSPMEVDKRDGTTGDDSKELIEHATQETNK